MAPPFPQQDLPDQHSAGGAADGERLASQGGRLRLLLAHLAGRAIRQRVELDDLVQEVYVRALTAARGLPPEEAGELALWRFLVRLARNTVIDAARSIRAVKRSGRTLPLAHSAQSSWNHGGPRAEEVLAKTAGPLTRVTASEAGDRIRERFEALLPEHRRVIGLRQFEGLSARESGLRMGRSEAAIHSLYRRALVAWHPGEEDQISSDDRDESDRSSRP